jgi:hypothetical protein
MGLNESRAEIKVYYCLEAFKGAFLKVVLGNLAE